MFVMLIHMDMISECSGSEDGGEVTWTSDAERFERLERNGKDIPERKMFKNIKEPKSFEVLEEDDSSFAQVIQQIQTQIVISS